MNETKPTTPEAKPKAPPIVAVRTEIDPREPVPVKVLRFTGPTDIPGSDVSMSLKSGGQVNQKRWDISYLPFMRHHRIVYFVAGSTTPAQVAYVHESRVSMWELA